MNINVASWKTTAAGIGALLMALGTGIGKYSSGEAISAADIGLIVTAVGLLFSKDHNVTGGTKQQ